eukprot:CAMPEP_0174331704 /NCGR_PEP_ID=MMETSP0810-20121108/17708_1 /TAXON_ID=73025 ORGANISM="Eutreptiella gymnastica-like, Strain CCMP1594" /NCGR_SAMPLE_ID=MMETSP0810 /ASSEMBLY_ACC=CAM_ASM_000659 /LENGTH=101 /DNA_ID=CAMNT_0015447667 /DNA_START=199 /DNA_END=500 /DNA_ORIENTATION=-
MPHSWRGRRKLDLERLPGADEQQALDDAGAELAQHEPLLPARGALRVLHGHQDPADDVQGRADAHRPREHVPCEHHVQPQGRHVLQVVLHRPLRAVEPPQV